MITSLFYIAVLAFSVQADTGADRTITKVVKLLQKMLDSSEQEGDDEQAIYTKFNCFCDESNVEKTAAIKESTKTIAYLENSIEEYTAEIGVAESDMHNLDASADDKQTDDKTRHKLFKEFEQRNVQQTKELEESWGQVREALNILASGDQTKAANTDSKKFMAGFKGSLASIQSHLSKVLTESSALMSTAQRDKADAFLQAPFTGNYNTQAAEVVGILKEIKKRIKIQIGEFKRELAKQTFAEEEMAELFKDEHKTLGRESDRKKRDVRDSEMHRGLSKEELEAVREDLEQANDFMSTLVPVCEEKSKSFSTRKLLRANEEAAIAQAISILNSDQAFMAFGSTDATASSRMPSVKKEMAASFLQLEKQSDVPKRQEAQKVLKQAAIAATSVRLPAVLAQLQAGNPFSTVLDEIDKMLEVVDEEDKADRKKKFACQKNIGQLRTARGDKKDDLELVQATLVDTKKAINNPVEGLLFLIQKTETELLENRQSQTLMTKTRTDENLAYQHDIASLDEAESILGKAVKVLGTYYNDLEKKIKAGEAGLLQKSHRWSARVDNNPHRRRHIQKRRQESDIGDATDKTWEGSYAGQSGDGGDAITMLSFILSETVKEKKLGHDTESTAQADFEDSMTMLKTKEASAEGRLDKLQGSLADTEEKLQTTKESKKATAQDLLATKELLKQTKADCKFMLDNFSLRVKNRQIETAALKRATRLIRNTPAFQSAEVEAAAADDA